MSVFMKGIVLWFSSHILSLSGIGIRVRNEVGKILPLLFSGRVLTTNSISLINIELFGLSIFLVSLVMSILCKSLILGEIG